MGESGVLVTIKGGNELGDEDGDQLVEEQKQWIRKKVELPYFNGSDLTGWLACVEKFF